MPRLPSRSTRALLAIALLAASSVALGIAVFAATESERSALDTAATRLDALTGIAHVVADDVDEQEAALDDFALNGANASLTRYQEAARREDAAMKVVATGDFNLPDIESALTTLSALTEDWRTQVAGPAIAARRGHDLAALDRFASVAVDDFAAIDAAAGHVEDLLERELSRVTEREAAVGVQRSIGTAVSFAIFSLAFGLALIVVRRLGRALERDARQASVLNRFTEVTSFAGEDHEIAAASLAALDRLVHPDASVTHVLNRSLDRAVPEATTGKLDAVVLPLHDLGRCSGMLRGTMYVSDDLADDLTVHCPVLPESKGTLACIPLRSGESVGAVHLYWATPNSLPLELRAAVSRVTEHAALAIGNRRLLAALHGQANTDPRTGLANSRAFDHAFEQTLAGRSAQEAVSVLMIDLDHFKLFNDRHGHPAGDEALRSFAGVLRSCMRDGDVAARYGGEEFAVLLPGVNRDEAVMVAERIRARTESTIISLAPGITDRITVSVGIASAPEQGLERIALLRLADEALYRAKEGGRNRIATAGDDAATDDSGAPGPTGATGSTGASIGSRLRPTARTRARRPA
jgi:diguanylate cyclase (GGDEF)-like protein